MLAVKLVTIFLLLPVGYIILRGLATFVFGYIHNRRAALKTGLPYVSVPFLDFNVVYGILARSPMFAPLVDKILPGFLTGWTKYSRPDWRFIHKYKVHQELGDLFQVITPELVVVNIADADVIQDVLGRRNEFYKVQKTLPPIKLYGDNVLVVEGHKWRHHRKIVAPPFTERNNHLVWEEAIRQATVMLDTCTTPTAAEKPPAIISSLKTLTINVISYAGFGVSLPYASESSNALTSSLKPAPGHTMTFKTAIEVLTSDFRKTVLIKMLPTWVMDWMPPALQQIEKAYHEFGDYLRELLQNETENPSGRENLLSALNRSEKIERETQGAGLSEAEMLGNVFLFAVAGHENTSAALEFIILNLALHPDKQEWLYEKIVEHLEGMPEDPHEWGYDLFRKLTGPICVMYETLRMYPPTPVVVRWTDENPQTLAYNDRTFVLPAKFVTAMNFIGLHYNPKYWGEDATEFRPERWEYKGTRENTNGEDSGVPSRFPGVKQAARGTFLPFGGGFRACLGRRLAEVEIVAVITLLFRKAKVSLKLQPGEKFGDAAARVQLALDRSSNQLSMAVRKDIGLVWSARN